MEMKLTLKYPIQPFFVSYPFGYPSAHYTASGMLGHNGIDLRAYHGQPVYAAHDGTCYLEIDNGGGNGVIIITDEKFEFEGQEVFFKTIYWHLLENNPAVESRQKVKAGDLIGYADNTGYSSGDHLHFGLKPVAQNEPPFSWVNTRQNNGYKGAIDPMPYFLPTKFIFTKTLRFGMWNNDVKELQKVLGGLVLDGAFGKKTLAGVKEFQASRGLVADGIVGVLTRAKLNA